MNTSTQTATVLAQDTKHLTPSDVSMIFEEAKAAAHVASLKHIEAEGEGMYCGFAWVDIFGVKGNTKLGKSFTAAGIQKSYTGGHQIWNPSGLGTQCMWTKEVGATAAADVFRKYGFRAYMGSRAD